MHTCRYATTVTCKDWLQSTPLLTKQLDHTRHQQLQLASNQLEVKGERRCTWWHVDAVGGRGSAAIRHAWINSKCNSAVLVDYCALGAVVRLR